MCKECLASDVCYSTGHEQCDSEETGVRAAVCAMRVQQRRLPTSTRRAPPLPGKPATNITSIISKLRELTMLRLSFCLFVCWLDN